MFEFHGWATIRRSPSPVEVDEDDFHTKTTTLVSEVRERLARLTWDSRGVVDLRTVNGAHHLWVAGYSNHRSGKGDEVISLFGDLAELAPGSYGLLYVLDDEDIDDGLRNQFQAWVLARGRLQRRDDTFLSPFVPVAEDPEVL